MRLENVFKKETRVKQGDFCLVFRNNDEEVLEYLENIMRYPWGMKMISIQVPLLMKINEECS